MDWKRDLSWLQEAALVVVVAIAFNFALGAPEPLVPGLGSLFLGAVVIGSYKLAVWGHTRYLGKPKGEAA